MADDYARPRARSLLSSADGLLMLRSCIFAAVLGDRRHRRGRRPLGAARRGRATANQLAHGAEQLHDLAANAGTPDEDWFRIAVPAHSSVEIVVDGVASTVGSDSDQFLTLVHAAGDLVARLRRLLLPGKAGRSLTYDNPTDADYVGKYARVRSQGCTTACGARPCTRSAPTTRRSPVPRFNNSGTQVTVLVLQNAAVTSPAQSVTGHHLVLGRGRRARSRRSRSPRALAGCWC